MTDEDIIVKFLERNYLVTTGSNDFLVTDTYDANTYTSKSFPSIFNKIMGSFDTLNNETSVEIFQRWYSSKKRELTKKLVAYFEQMDGNLGSRRLLDNAVTDLEKEGYTGQFIINWFNDYYYKKFLTPKLEAYLTKFDKSNDSGVLIDAFDYQLAEENPTQYDLAVNFLNAWYCNNVVLEKVNDFLSQLVITIGKTNWIVTWIGHGPVTDITLRKAFKKENAFQFSYVKGLYEEWYDKEVIEASERLMKLKKWSDSADSVIFRPVYETQNATPAETQRFFPIERDEEDDELD